MCEAEVNSDPKEVDKRLAYTIHRLEGESGHLIDSDYPFFKFMSKVSYYTMVDKETRKKK